MANMKDVRTHFKRKGSSNSTLVAGATEKVIAAEFSMVENELKITSKETSQIL